MSLLGTWRRRALGLVLLALAGLGVWAWQERVHLRAFPGIVGAYSAKEYCSCRYVTGNSAQYCAGYIEQSVPLSGFFDDVARKRVTARGLGSSQTAVWVGQRQGCQLLPQADALPETP
ncbi:MAG: amidase [Pseudomonas sp.]|uniref:amidase n=1 Tax=Pseudomonas sp. TaxID=306 RepID=UPI0033927981